MEFKIQNIVFPMDEKHMMCRNLFYNGDIGFLDLEKKSISLNRGQQIDFVSYLNACSWAKWKKFTDSKDLSLHLDVEGPVRIRMIGFHMEYWELERTVFDVCDDTQKERREIVLNFPENDETIVGVEICPMGDFTVYGGFYTVEIPENSLRDVDLSIATTTFKREQYILKNIQLLRDELINGKDEIKDHLFVHVVDNGRTLHEEDVVSRHIFLHPNPNVGGSGGFARGMLESLHQEVKVSHVLLMDDDVLVLPESILRTYKLLRALKPEYHGHFISGAMLRLEKPMMQHEDIGTVTNSGFCQPLKPAYNLFDLYNVVKNEGSYFNGPNQYAAWWHCCMPVSVIHENGLPLPLFVRIDDAEYGLRCHAKVLTMNGICIWQPGFDLKYNPAMDLYQTVRNFMIAKSTTHSMEGIDIIGRFLKQIPESLDRFCYNEAELIVEGLEDYMKGPEYLVALDAEKRIGETRKLNETLEPLSAHPDIYIREIADIFIRVPQKRFQKQIRNITRNGNRLTPSFMYHKNRPVTNYGWDADYNAITLVKEYAAVNPYEEKVVIRHLDKERYRKFMKRYKALRKDMKKRGNQVAAEWYAQKDRFTSEEFWKDYLGLE